MARPRKSGARHDIGVCTNDNRRDYLCDHGWRYWPADGSFTKNSCRGRLSLVNAFVKELEGLSTCPVCRTRLLSSSH